MARKGKRPRYAFGTLAMVTATLAACAVGEADGKDGADVLNAAWKPLICAQLGWLFLVGVVVPAIAAFTKSDQSERRGLNLPRGSVRSILALLIVGSFVNVLVFGPMGTDVKGLDTVIAAFGALAGSVLGFYFGSRTAK